MTLVALVGRSPSGLRGLDPDLLRELDVTDPGDLCGRVARALPAAHGVVVLATCARLEIYLEIDDLESDPKPALLTGVVGPASRPQAQSTDLPEHDQLRTVLAARTQLLRGDAVVTHLFEVAAGLLSPSVGEREIAGQVRRAAAAARTAGWLNAGLDRLFQAAARAARAVHATGDGPRRSLVAAALDLAAPPVWADLQVLLVGTGAYARTAARALRARGCRDLRVHSRSGRAADFAAVHAAIAVTADELPATLATTDLVVTCSGTGAPVLRAAQVAQARAATTRPLTVLDLALHPDVEPAVGALPEVRLLDLATVQARLADSPPPAELAARRVVRTEVAAYLAARAARTADDAVVALRSHVAGLVAAELERIDASGLPEPAREQVARSLHRLAQRLLHEPSVRARALAAEGRDEEIRLAVHSLFGVEPSGVETAPGAAPPSPPDRREDSRSSAPAPDGRPRATA